MAGAPTAAACMSSSTVDPMTFGAESSHLNFKIEEGFLTNVPMDDGWLGDATPPIPSEQVPGSSGMGVPSSVFEMVDDLLTSAPTEDWEDSFRDLLQFHDDGSATFDAVLQSTEVVPWVPPAQTEQPTMPLLGGLTMMELCRTVWGSGLSTEEAMDQTDVSEEDRPLLRLLIETVVTSSRYVTNAMLTEFTTDIAVDSTGVTAVSHLLTALCAICNRQQ